MKSKSHSSWEESSSWYDSIVGEKGHYYHQSLIIPKVVALLELNNSKEPKLLDLGCGQGILARNLPKNVNYLGIDASDSLLHSAKKFKEKNHSYLLADLTKPLQLQQKDFTHAAIILALQNMQEPLLVLKNAEAHLVKKARLVIVLNHPCFRIPRQSSWQIDSAKKLQFRRIDRYFSPMSIPIQTSPSKNERSAQTFSYHFSLSSYSSFLKQAGFAIIEIQEWCSDKKSTGKNATMENRARAEFPLFLTIVAEKI
jgi:ubiquinone/menaquinone biosynthesis C-methylase UbiE